jgi:hypothetical protein
MEKIFIKKHAPRVRSLIYDALTGSFGSWVFNES